MIFITESWLTDDYSSCEIRFHNFETYRLDRNVITSNKSRGGGVMILVHSRLMSRLISVDKPTLNYDHVFAAVEFNDAVLLLGCVYIPPRSSFDVYLEHAHVVESLHVKYPNAKFYIAGDYNLRDSVWRTEDEDENGLGGGMLVDCPPSSPAIQLCEIFNGLTLHQVNSLPNNHGAFLDLVFSHDSSVQTFLAIDLLLPNNFHHVAFCFDVYIEDQLEFLSSSSRVYD